MRDNPLPTSPENSGEGNLKVDVNEKYNIYHGHFHYMYYYFLHSIDIIHPIRELSHGNSHHNYIRKHKQRSSLSNAENLR